MPFFILFILLFLPIAPTQAQNMATAGGASFSVMNHDTGVAAYATGINDAGQLGISDPSASNASSLIRVQRRRDFSYEALPIWWPYGTFGRSGAMSVAAPFADESNPNFTSVVSGSGHTLALRADGAVWAWGRNDKGQLGDGTIINRPGPVQVVGLPAKAIAIAAGENHSLAVMEGTGAVWAWGDNRTKQLGTNEPIYDSPTPVQVVTDSLNTLLSGVRAVAASATHSLALKNDGSVWAWGINKRGQLGTGDKLDSLPKKVTGLGQVTAITAGGGFSRYDNEDPAKASSRNIVQDANGDVWGWGSNSHCELADPSFDSVVLAPQKLTSLSGQSISVNAKTIAYGLYHSIALDAVGMVKTWGNNDSGQLGDDTTEERCAPIAILDDVETVSAGKTHMMVC